MNTKIAAGALGLSLLLSLTAVIVSTRGLNQRNLDGEQATEVDSPAKVSSSEVAWPQPVKSTPVKSGAAGPPAGNSAVGSPTVTPAGEQTLNSTAGSTAEQASVRLPGQAVVVSKDALEDEATRAAEQLLELLPNNANALHVKAMLNAQLHNTAEAEELWTKCIELDPTSEPYYINLAAIAIDRGENQLAIDTLRAANERGIQSADINHHLGVALNNIGESAAAAEIARQTLASLPDSGAHWFILGQAQLQSGELEEAETSLKRALELGGHSKALYFALFNVSARLGKKEAAQEYRTQYSSFKEVELKVEERYQILSEAEALRVCISILSEAVALYRAIPDLQTAEHYLLRILALEPDNLPACQDLLEIYVKRRELANEISVRQRITELNSTNLLNYLLLAKALSQTGAQQAAEAQIKLAISLAPQMVTGYAAMADFLLEQSQPSQAQWYVEQAIRIKPSRQGFELLARTLAEQGKLTESRAALEMSKLPEPSTPTEDSK